MLRFVIYEIDISGYEGKTCLRSCFSAERREFLKHLATLREEGNTFLSMLNDTRRQVRELYYSGNNGDGAVGIQAYRYDYFYI